MVSGKDAVMLLAAAVPAGQGSAASSRKLGSGYGALQCAIPQPDK